MTCLHVSPEFKERLVNGEIKLKKSKEWPDRWRLRANAIRIQVGGLPEKDRKTKLPWWQKFKVTVTFLDGDKPLVYLDPLEMGEGWTVTVGGEMQFKLDVPFNLL